jgi:hypothetical protein
MCGAYCRQQSIAHNRGPMHSPTDDRPQGAAWLGRATAVVLAAALGAAFGDLLLTSLIDSANWIAIAVAAPLMYLASRHFLDPLSSGIRASVGLPPADAEKTPTGRGLWALAAGSAVMLVWLSNVLGEYAQEHPGSVLATIAVSIALVGGITLAWIVGARSAWPLAAILGAVVGFLVNGIATVAVLAAQGVPVTPELVAASAESALSVAAAGFAGGIVVDAGAARRPALVAPLAALAVFAVTALIAAWHTGNVSVDYVLPNMLLGLGWLLGLSSSPYADALLRRSASKAA